MAIGAAPNHFKITFLACAAAALLSLAILQSCDDANGGDSNDNTAGDNNGNDPAVCRDAPEPPWSQKVEDEALKTLRDFLRTDGLGSPHPWATGHAMLGLGKDVRVHNAAGNSEDALSFIFQFMQKEPRAGKVIYDLPPSRQGIQVEPHSDMFIKIFDDIGVPLDETRNSPVGDVSVKDLHESARLAFINDPERLMDDIAWSLQAFTRDPAQKVFTTAEQGEATIEAMIDWTLIYLGIEWKAVREARESWGRMDQEGLPPSTCAGWHTFQGLAVALSRGFGTPKQRTTFDEWLPDVEYRIRCEPNVLRDAFPKSYEPAGEWAGEPRAVVAIQFARGAQERLKFYGHALESLAYAVDGGLIPMTKPWTDRATTCRACIAEAVQDLVTLKFYGAESRIGEWADHEEPEYRQMYFDAIGDAGHALHGLQMWRDLEAE